MFFLLFFQVELPFKTLIVQFSRETIGTSEQSNSRGEILFDRSGKLVVNVKDPIRQIMIFEGKNLVIYYPVEKKAFRITAQTPFSLPVVSALMGSLYPNYGLDTMGYRLEKTEKKGDTLVSYWQPPSHVRNILGTFMLVEHQRKLIYAESKRADGTLATVARFDKYVRVNNMLLALQVEAQHISKDDIYIEKTNFDNPQFNKNLPDSLINFRIPSGIAVRELVW